MSDVPVRAESSVVSSSRATVRALDAALDGEQQPSAWRRNPACVERWPECRDGEYNPACCRFPKACSCDELVGEQS